MGDENTPNADPGTTKQAATLLRKRVWEPCEKRMAGAKTVFISPDGQLGALPFIALPGSDPNKYLIEDFNILILPVPRLLAQFEDDRTSVSRPAGDLLLIGDVDYSEMSPSARKSDQSVPRRRGTERVLRSNNSSWDSLQGTQDEVESIRRLFSAHSDGDQQGTKILRNSAANESNFRDQAPHFERIHLATHGFFASAEIESGDVARDDSANQRFRNWDKENVAQFKDVYHPGLLSGLVFAGANQESSDPKLDDGIMTADEISGLQLSGVDLVTLSACETGLGKTAGGEGLIGIQRAFQIAGARTTVASLWKVDDLATRHLMERFYKNLFEKKMDKLQALTEAQRWMLKNPQQTSDTPRGKRKLSVEGRSERTHPYYWAAWVTSGDWK